MSVPWYDAALYGWLPGTLLGVSGGILGAFIGYRAAQGRLNRGLLKLLLALITVSALLMLSGITALVLHQPYDVWYSLLLPGVVGIVVLGANLLVVVKHLRHQASAAS